MISDKLKKIFLISIIVFIAHGIEEFLTEFTKIDFSYRYIMNLLTPLGFDLAVGWTFQVLLWLLLIVAYLLMINKRSITLALLTIWGLVFIFEFHHIYKTLTIGSYYPGLITALIFVGIGVWFWRELLKEFGVRR